MYRMLTVLTKQPDVSDADFRHFMREDYGPVYQAMSQVRSYRQWFLSPLPGADVTADRGPHAVVEIAFDDVQAMRDALDSDAYRSAAAARTRYMARIDARVVGSVNVLA